MLTILQNERLTHFPHFDVCAGNHVGTFRPIEQTFDIDDKLAPQPLLMDPVSITAAAASLVYSVVRNGRALAAIYDKYQDAHRCIFQIQAECTVLAAALSQIEILFTRSSTRAKRCPDNFIEALDISLVGCTLTLSALSKEIEVLQNADTKKKKAKYVWKEQTINELLQQLRGQTSALNLLLQAFDSSSTEHVVRSGEKKFQGVKKGSESVRKAYPNEKYAESILSMSFDDTRTLYSLENPQVDDLEKSFSTLASTLASPSPPPVRSGWKAQYSVDHKEW
jgi:hypothetical protein